MAKLPGEADLGPAPNVEPARPVGSYDVSAYARGAQEIAQGARALGTGVEQAGQGVADFTAMRGRWQYAMAQAGQTADLAAAANTLQTDNTYGPDDSGKPMQDRYADQVQQIRDKWSATIEDPAFRDRFVGATAPQTTRFNDAVAARTRSLGFNDTITKTQQMGNTLMQSALDAPDDATRAQLIDSHNGLIDGLQSMGAVTPEQALTMKQGWAKQYATADVLQRSNADPEGVINELRAAPGSDDAIVNRILSVEGTGSAKGSTATGPGQFTDGTWLSEIKRNRPDLAQGRSDADILALRADPTLGRQMTGALLNENRAYLQKEGLPTDPGALYLAHFLGAGGAAAVLKADPGTPVSDALAKAVGPDQAKAMVAANPTILGGRLVGSVRQWADSKMGGVGPDGSSLYSLLSPEIRETAIAHAQAALHRQTSDGIAAFHQSVQDDTAEAMANGAVTNPKNQGDFVAHYGIDNGPQAFQQYQATLQLGADKQRLASMPAADMATLVKSYTPQPGAQGFAQAQQRQSVLAGAAQQLQQERAADPAAYVARYMPGVKDAYAALDKVLGDPTATPDAKAAAARDYVTKSTMEQQHLGIPADQVRAVPKTYVDTFSHTIAAAAGSDDPQKRVGLIGQIQSEAQMWGDQWPAIMREIAPTSQPIVRAIAAGADPVAMTRLLSLDPKTKPAEILKEQDAAKAADLNKSVDDALAPFRSTLVGRQLDRDFPGYYGLASTLGALYVRDGMSTSDAAGKAFNDLIGSRYDFRDTYRIPKSAGVGADDVQSGAQVARGQLGKFNVSPAIDDLGLGSTNTADSLTKFGRDGKWVTAPDNSGLNLAYGDKFVRTSAGKPLLLSWSQLAGMGKADAAAPTGVEGAAIP